MQQAYLGPGSISQVQNIVERHGARSALVVGGERSFDASGAARALADCFSQLRITRFKQFGTYPELHDVTNASEVMRATDPDIVIAIGGGTAMDIAKLANAIAMHNTDCAALITGKQLISLHGKPLIAIPTTAGTGSEATEFAVAYIGHRKFSVSHPFLLPNYAVVDSVLTHTMPPRLTATTGLDALSQAIESYWAVGATSKSQSYSAQAINELLPSIRGAVNAPTEAVRQHMAHGAHLAGKAINIARTTAAHAISYWLTSKHGVPHGHAVFLSLGKLFLINDRGSEINDTRGRRYVRQTLNDLYELLGCSSAEECCVMLNALLKDVGLPATFQEVGLVTQKDRNDLVNAVNTERLSNNPIKITRQSLYALFD